MCHVTGWAWDYVDMTLTVPRLNALHKEWERHPPMHLLFAAWLGIRPKETGTAEELVQRIHVMGK